MPRSDEQNHRLTVITFKWQGWRPTYTHKHVNALGRMLKRYLPLPHRFVCVTDDPTGIETETFPLWPDPVVVKKPMRQDSFCRLKLFSAWAADQWSGWVLQIDLDVLIVSDLSPLISWDDFRILQGASSTPYNGGFWLHRTGTREQIWNSFNPETSPFAIRKRTTRGRPWRGSDQGWISIAAPGARLYTRGDGVYQSGRRGIRVRPKNAKLVLFPGDVKPWHPEIKGRTPWAYREYLSFLT